MQSVGKQANPGTPAGRYEAMVDTHPDSFRVTHSSISVDFVDPLGACWDPREVHTGSQLLS